MTTLNITKTRKSIKSLIFILQHTMKCVFLNILVLSLYFKAIFNYLRIIIKKLITSVLLFIIYLTHMSANNNKIYIFKYANIQTKLLNYCT